MTTDKLLEEVALALYKHSGWNNWESEPQSIESEWKSRAQAAIAVMRKREAELVEALEGAKNQAEYIHVALQRPAERNPVCASLRVWSGGIIRDCEQALASRHKKGV